MKCPKCQGENPDATQFCGHCGANLFSSQAQEYTETIQILQGELLRGQLFAERYEVIEQLGRGGMGTVYRVYDQKIQEDVAIKILKSELAGEEGTITRFRNELRLARKITNKNICKMYDLNDYQGLQFITMEYIAGEDLKSFIRRSGRVSIGKAISIAKQMCEGLHEAHDLGVIHRDLKPSNIMIDSQGNTKIMDFGIARSTEAKGITEAGVIIGTPEYMSPEQVEGADVDPRSDIYSLGAILYELVTGRPPFEGKTPMSVAFKHKTSKPQEPRELNTQVPEELNRLILKCLEKDREKRHQNVDRLLEDLKELHETPSTGQIKVEARMDSSTGTQTSFSLKKLLLPPAILLGVLATVFVLVWLFQKKDQPTSITEEEFVRGALVLSSREELPEIVFKVDPVLPEQIREKGLKGGEVVLKIRVDKAGEVEALKVVFSIPLLDQAAIDAVKQWKFKPKIIENKAVPVVFTVSVPFDFEKQEEHD
jgi:TonB family protein